ncbi:MAG TPA: methyltransferase domain-containing protein [Jatrophihabitans sp.]
MGRPIERRYRPYPEVSLPLNWVHPIAEDRPIEATRSLAPAALELTGERTAPGIASENYWFRRHQVAYLHLREQVEGPRLLEVGAGEGYGSALLAERVPAVLALDYDPAAIAHLLRRYPALAAIRGNLAALPVAGDSIDSVVSLQVIEHVWDHPQFLAECARVLRPSGLLVLSTPNRLTFSPGTDRPVNPFHTHEFTAAELCRLVAGNGLPVVSVRGLFAGPRLAELDRRYAERGGFVAAQLAEPPEHWPAELAADVAEVSWQDFRIGPDLLDGSKDLSSLNGLSDVTDFSGLDDSLDLLVLARRP